ncbi:hypothetical protein BGW42_005916 [Actinomortierella wolfii]|nr:hypothetical protein BGW42_005916 [Actinomortierella wolfii]
MSPTSLFRRKSASSHDARNGKTPPVDTKTPPTPAICHTVEIVKDNEHRKGYDRPATPYVESDAFSDDSAGSEDSGPRTSLMQQQQEQTCQPQAFHLTFIDRRDEDSSGSRSDSPGAASTSSSLSTIDSDFEPSQLGFKDSSPPSKILTPNTSLSSMSSVGLDSSRKSTASRHHRVSSSSALSPPIKPALKSPTRPQAHVLPSAAGTKSPVSPKVVSWAEMLDICVFESYEDEQDDTWLVHDESFSPDSQSYDDSDMWDNDSINSLVDLYRSPESTIALRRNRSHRDVRDLFIDDECTLDPQKIENDICDMEVQRINMNGSAGLAPAALLDTSEERKSPSSAAMRIDSDLSSCNSGKPLPARPPTKSTSRPPPTPPPTRPSSTSLPSSPSRRPSTRKPVRRVSVKSPEVYERLASGRQSAQGRVTPTPSRSESSSMGESLSSPSDSAKTYADPISTKEQASTAASFQSEPAVPAITIMQEVPSSRSPEARPQSSTLPVMASTATPTPSSASWFSKIFRSNTPSDGGLLNRRLTASLRSPQSTRPLPTHLDVAAGNTKDTCEQKTAKSPTLSQILSPAAKFSQLKSAISGGISSTLRSPLFSPRSQASTSFSAALSKLSKSKDVNSMPQLPPRDDGGPLNTLPRPVPKAPSIAASARRQSTRSPQLYPCETAVEPMSLTHAASMVINGAHTLPRSQSRTSDLSGHGTQLTRSSTSVESVPSSHRRVRPVKSCPTIATSGKEEIHQASTRSAGATLSPEKRRQLSQTISGRAIDDSPPLEHKRIIRTVQATPQSGRSKVSSSVETQKSPATRSSHQKVPLVHGYDHQALERIIPERPSTPLWQYIHAATHKPNPGLATGVLFIRVVSIKDFQFPIPSEHTMVSVRVDTGRERVDTDYVSINDMEMLLGQEFCLPVFADTTLTLTVHLMQAPHLFDDNDVASAENYRLLTSLIKNGVPPTRSLSCRSPASPTTSSSAPSTPSTFGTTGGIGGGRLGRLLTRRWRSKGADKSKDKQRPSSSLSGSFPSLGSQGSQRNITSVSSGSSTASSSRHSSSSSCDMPARDPATLTLCQHALFEDELCIAKSAVRFKDLRHACENEVTIADFEAFNNWYGPRVDRRNKTNEDFSMLDDGNGDLPNANQGDTMNTKRGGHSSHFREEAKMVAKICTKVCFIPGPGLEPENSLLDSPEDAEGTTVDEHGEPVRREPYNLRECGQAERYLAWNRRHVCEGHLFYLTEGGRQWRREWFTLIGCKIWRRLDDDQRTTAHGGTDSNQDQHHQQQREGGMYLDLEDLDRVQTVKGSFSAIPVFALPNQAKMIKEGIYDALDVQDEISAGSFLPLRNGFRLWFKNGFTQDFYADDDKDAEEWVTLILEVCRRRPPKPTWL